MLTVPRIDTGRCQWKRRDTKPKLPFSAMAQSSKNIRLYPWRDGCDRCLKQLLPPSSQNQQLTTTLPTKSSIRRRQLPVSSIRNGQYTYTNEETCPLTESSGTVSESATLSLSPIENVDVCLDATDCSGNHCDKDDITRLFDAIAQLPNLASFMVRSRPTPSGSYPHSFLGGPSLSALTHVLSNASSLHYFTLIGIPLHYYASKNAECDTSDDDLDWEMNAFLEVLRIHPGLQSVAMKDCSFATDSHRTKCQTILDERKLLSANSFVQHNNTVISQEQKQKQTQFEDHVPPSWWSQLCLCGVVLVSVGSLWQVSMCGV